MNEQQIVDKLNELETKRWIYNDNWGPDSDEVKSLTNQITDLNAKLLDFMCPE